MCSTEIIYELHNAHGMRNYAIWATSQENLSSGFATRVDLNWSVQPQKLGRGLKFRIKKLELLYYLGRKNKGADQTAQMFFAYGINWFSHDVAQMFCDILENLCIIICEQIWLCNLLLSEIPFTVGSISEVP